MTELALLSEPPEGVEWSATHLSVLDPSLSFETYEQLVRAAGVLGDAGRWILGDLLVYGDNRYGEKYAQTLELARVGEDTLKRYRYVCAQIVSGRRRPNLSFSHHREVARLEPRDQDRLLERAERDDLSVVALRDLVRDLGALHQPPPRARQQVLAAPQVDAARGLSEARETLVRVGTGLEAETAERVGIPSAIRAIDEAGETVKRAAALLERPSLVDAARRVKKNATVSGGFHMVESPIFQAFADAVPDE